ncbi:trypsin-like serine protease [Shewanella sp. 5_MG-2023]|uniref:S1 family peptidase n=1 Tax=unclassified Shewanella TaxID=196818 RepID=UPI0026E3C894|nr:MULTISPECIES: trypsin-like serine protease [unclassified Shewanella]MDO6641028.1 trypsin-like serine protease [Shewanella sp. 5_MG-2023]MDO6776310.1 trypsin-like serine protease [Shewanella sp. 3_MG-2023]
MKWMYLLTLVISLNAHAIVIRHDVPDQKYQDAAKSDNSTVTFYGIYQGEEIVEGTGALIARDWVVTAAHVAKYLKKDGKVLFKNSQHKIEQVVSHPLWEDKKFPNDIALVKLTKPIESATIASLYTSSNEIGKTATFIGRGDHGNGLTGVTGADGKIRLAKNQVDSAEDQWIRFIFEQGDTALPLEGISGPGDSGGPAYVNLDGQLYIIGVSSWQNAEPTEWREARYGVIENYSRISHFKEWIKKTVAGGVL